MPCSGSEEECPGSQHSVHSCSYRKELLVCYCQPARDKTFQEVATENSSLSKGADRWPANQSVGNMQRNASRAQDIQKYAAMHLICWNMWWATNWTRRLELPWSPWEKPRPISIRYLLVNSHTSLQSLSWTETLGQAWCSHSTAVPLDCVSVN